MMNNNVSSFFDTTAERMSMSIPALTTSLSFDSLIIQDEEEDCVSDVLPLPLSRSRGMSQDFPADFDLDTAQSPVHPPSQLEPQEDGDGEEEEEIKQIRTANLLQRTLYMELEKLKNTDAESSEHPLLQGEVRGEDSELLVTGELKNKSLFSGGAYVSAGGAGSSIASIISSVMQETQFDTWQEGFSLYLERRLSQQSQQQEHTQQEQEQRGTCGKLSGGEALSATTGCSQTQTQSQEAVSSNARASASSSHGDGSGGTITNINTSISRSIGIAHLEKKPDKETFLFSNVNWASASPSGPAGSGPAAGIASIASNIGAVPNPFTIDMATSPPTDLFTISENTSPAKAKPGSGAGAEPVVSAWGCGTPVSSATALVD
jgi:hypothetical protein